MLVIKKKYIVKLSNKRGKEIKTSIENSIQIYNSEIRTRKKNAQNLHIILNNFVIDYLPYLRFTGFKKMLKTKSKLFNQIQIEKSRSIDLIPFWVVFDLYPRLDLKFELKESFCFSFWIE